MKPLLNHRSTLSLALLAAGPTMAHAAPPSDSAYFTDPQSSYVQDATSDSIGQVNMITCIMHAMRPDALVNKGPYIALIDKNACDSEKTSAVSSGAGAGASQAPDYMTTVVNSTRASNSTPMLTTAWISLDQDGMAVTVLVHISATEAPSTGNPYGAFRIDYCGKADGVSGCVMNGFMEGGSGLLSYYEVDHGGGDQVTALKLTSVGTASGTGSLNVQDSGNGSSAFNFAYNQQYFLRQDSPASTQCFNRDATDPQTGLSVWQYGLYDSTTGARVERNSGFPIQYVAGGTTYQGFLGYYGMSLPPEAAATLLSGATVQKIDYTNGSAPVTTAYTAAINGGRLTRYTRKTRTLKDIDQVHFNAFVNSVAGSGLPDANSQYEMYWDDATGKFIVTAQMQCGQNGCQTVPLTPVSVDATVWISSGGVQGWSQSLGGDVFVDLAGVTGAVNSTTSANVSVIYHVQDMVYPDDSSKPAVLYCVSNCPTEATLQSYFAQSGGNVQSPFVPVTNGNQPLNLPDVVTYAVDAKAQLAGGDGSAAAAVYTDANSMQNFPMYQGGVMSGRLFVDLADAECFSGQFCDFAVNSAAVYYQWQTGSNTWNQFSAVKDGSGNFVHFDAPLDVDFTVPAGASYGSYAGTSLILQYNGFGNLSGIPGSCVSQTTNMNVECNVPGARYVPQFVIPYDPNATPRLGVVTTAADNVTTTYLAKWLQREIRFAQKAPSVCSDAGLQAPTGVQLPTAADLKDTSDSSSDVYLGIEPTVTGAPRVIQGEVKF